MSKIKIHTHQDFKKLQDAKDLLHLRRISDLLRQFTLKSNHEKYEFYEILMNPAKVLAYMLDPTDQAKEARFEFDDLRSIANEFAKISVRKSGVIDSIKIAPYRILGCLKEVILPLIKQGQYQNYQKLIQQSVQHLTSQISQLIILTEILRPWAADILDDTVDELEIEDAFSQIREEADEATKERKFLQFSFVTRIGEWKTEKHSDEEILALVQQTQREYEETLVTEQLLQDSKLGKLEEVDNFLADPGSFVEDRKVNVRQSVQNIDFDQFQRRVPEPVSRLLNEAYSKIPVSLWQDVLTADCLDANSDIFQLLYYKAHDREIVEMIISTLSDAATIDVTSFAGKAAIEKIVWHVGELAGQLSDHTRDNNAEINFRELFELRNNLHDLCNLRNLERHIAKLEGVGVVENFDSLIIKAKLASLLAQFESFSYPDYDQLIADLDTQAPSPHAYPPSPKFIQCDLLFTLIRKVVGNGCDSENMAIKFRIIENIAAGCFPFPDQYSIIDLVQAVFADELNAADNTRGLITAFHKVVTTKEERSQIREITDADKVMKNGKLSSKKMLPKPADKRQEEGHALECSKILNLMLEILQKPTPVDDQAFAMHFVQYKLVVVGEIVTLLNTSDKYKQYAQPCVVAEFENLRWLRNGLMHDQEHPVLNSVMKFFRDDLGDCSAFSVNRLETLTEYINHMVEVISDLQQVITNQINPAESDDSSIVQTLLLRELEAAKDEESYAGLLVLLTAGFEDREISPVFWRLTQISNAIVRKFALEHLKKFNADDADQLIADFEREVIKNVNVHSMSDLDSVKFAMLDKIAEIFHVNILYVTGNQQSIQQNYYRLEDGTALIVECSADDASNASVELAYFKMLMHQLLGKRISIIEFCKTTIGHVDKIISLYDDQFVTMVTCYKTYKKTCELMQMAQLGAASADIIKLIQDNNGQLLYNCKYMGYSLVHFTMYGHSRQYDLLKYLIKNCGVDQTILDKHGKTLAHEACRNNDLEMVVDLMECGVSFLIADVRRTLPESLLEITTTESEDEAKHDDTLIKSQILDMIRQQRECHEIEVNDTDENPEANIVITDGCRDDEDGTKISGYASSQTSDFEY